MTENDLREIIAGVVERYSVPALAQGEFTVTMLAQERGITYNEAVTILRRAMAAGAIVKVGRRRTMTGHTATAYHLAK